MATAVRYNGPSTSATVRGSDGVLYTCPNGSQVTVPDDTATALFAEGWTAPDGTTPVFTPPGPKVVEDVFLVNGVLSRSVSGAYVPVSGATTGVGPLEGLPIVSTRTRHVDANLTPTTALSNGTDTVNTALIRHVVTSSGYGLRLRYDNFIVANNGNVLPGEVDGPQAITVQSMIQLPDGSQAQAKYRGALSWTIDPGAGVLADTLGVYFTVGDAILEFCRVQVATAATKFQLGVKTRSADGEGVDHTTGLALGAAVTASSEYAYASTALAALKVF